MTEEILEALVSTLNDAFSGETAISLEKIRQGFLTPCLFIERGKVFENKLFGNRFIRNIPFIITYFPKKGEPQLVNFELNKVMEKLFWALNMIKTKDGTYYNGYSMEAVNRDETLVFSVTYKAIINKVPDEEKELMAQIEYIKGCE